MEEQYVQQHYPLSFQYCYGCGPLNPHGLRIKSYWQDDEAVAHFQPEPYQLAFPGVVYGGLLASLIDCHCIGTAAAAAYRQENREPGSLPVIRYVTGSLAVDFLRPTPLGPELTVRARVEEIHGRKTRLLASIEAAGIQTVSGTVLAVRISAEMFAADANPFT